MSKLEELINKLCPNGVEFKKLIEITTWDKKFNGIDNSYKKIFKHISAEQLKKFNSDSGNIKLLSTGIFDGYAEEEKCKEFINEGDVLTLPSGGTANIKYFSGKFLDSGNIIAITRDEKKYNIKYIYYNLINIQSLIQSFYRGSGVKHPDMANILNINIPVPPLEVQCEIVRILDNFTLLSAELSAELSARQKQYEYYCNKLLNNVETKEITFGEACDVITDYVAAGSFGDIAKNVQYINIPDYAQLIRTVDIKNNFQKADYIYVSEKAFNYLWRVNLDKECIILPNIGVNCGEVYYLNPEMLIYEKNVLGPNAILVRSNTNNIKYLSYVFKTNDFQKQLRRIISPAGQTKFNKTELKKLILHLPSKEIQDNVVEKLEKFDKLCNDLSEGLPAEIEARKKQYEYYRDKLLTFKELK